VQKNIADNVLLSKQNNIQPTSRLTRSHVNKSLFAGEKDKDSNETVTFISAQTLRNTAANKKQNFRKK